MFKFVLKSGSVFLIAAFILFCSVAGYHAYTGSKPAPDVAFTTITGKRIVLASLLGKPVIVTFWATDCPACIEEIPHLLEWYHRYHGLGLEIVAVAMVYDPPSHVVNMAKTAHLPYDVVLDLNSGHARAFGNVNLTPTTFLINPEGRIIEHILGVIDPVKMTILIEDLIKG